MYLIYLCIYYNNRFSLPYETNTRWERKDAATKYIIYVPREEVYIVAIVIEVWLADIYTQKDRSITLQSLLTGNLEDLF